MKKRLLLIALMLMLAIPIMAQNEDLTVEPVATEEAVATQEAGNSGGATNGNGVSSTTTDSNFAVIVLLISNVISYGIILAQSIMQNGSVNRKTLDSFFAGLRGLGKFIPGDQDDKLFAGFEAGANAILGSKPAEQPPVTNNINVNPGAPAG